MLGGLGVVESSSERDQLSEKLEHSKTVQGETYAIGRYLGDSVEI